MSNVILISGDVHMGQFYSNKCRSLSGQKNLIELTSSGLSHSQTNFFPFAHRNMVLFTPKFYAVDDPVVALNYGKIKINQGGV